MFATVFGQTYVRVSIITTQRIKNKMITMFDDIFAMLDRLASTATIDYPETGLKSILPRPHNLYVEQDSVTGEIAKWIIETVYTPFTKSDISVKFKKDRFGTRLFIAVGNNDQKKIDESKTDKVDGETEQKTKKTLSTCRYKGLSTKSFEIEFPLPDTVNPKDITVKAEDGLLTIELPVDHSADSELQLEIK